MKRIGKGKFQKGIALLCMGMLLVTPISAEAKSGSDSTLVPADAASGGVIYSNIYGEVLVTRQADGTYNYSFFNDDWPAVQELLSALRAGKQINLDKLLTESSTDINKITTEDDVVIPNDIVNSGAAATSNRGGYGVGSVYGPDLDDAELEQVQTMVSSFLIKNNVASMSDIQKVRTAHDYLVQYCIPAPRNNWPNANNAWGALIYHQADAKGYARAMKALCDGMGIATYIISANSSSAVKDYMWNAVMINGEWYIVDVFCDDSTSSYATYLLSDRAYWTLGMRWDKGDGVPVSKKNYGEK